MPHGYTTVQHRHSDKWLPRITNVRAFTLVNGFSGEACPVDALRFAIDRLGDNLLISKDKTTGKLHCHSNCWYEFDVRPVCPECDGRGWVGAASGAQFAALGRLAVSDRLPMQPCSRCAI